MVTDQQMEKGPRPFALAYVSAGCNLTPRSLDWLGSHNLIAYGSHSSVHIYKPEESGGKVIQTLCGHKNRVNAVRWLNTLGESRAVVPEIATASSDSMVRIWSLIDGEFANTSIIKGHDGAVTDLTGLFMSESNALAIVASAGTDFSIKLWKRNDFGENFALLDSIDLKSSLCVALEVSALPGLERDVALLAISTETLGVQLFSISIRTAGANSTTKLATLTGHEDWVRGLSFTPFIDSTDMFLASSSQDTTVRIWKISRSAGPESTEADADDPDEFRLEKKSFLLDNQTFSVTLETVLIGHEGWVYASKWVPPATKAADLQLMTFSFDHTIILWSPDPSSGGVWLERARLGNVGGEALGFLGGAVGPNGRSVVAHSHQGSLNLWQFVTSKSGDEDDGRWCPKPIVGGHFGEVTDIAWEKNGRYLLSVSADQTTRLHAQWKTPDTSSEECNWYELARPQIHGYSMNSIATLPDFKFVSAADEKVARAFAAPFNTLESLRSLSGVEIPTEALGNSSEPVGATVPALGLSNKAVYTERSEADESKSENVNFTRQNLKEPPTDDFLSQNSLWPEIMKLYGHGYDVYSVAASNSGRHVATACKATTAEHARLILWNTSNWEKEQDFLGSGHTLTVTQMCFSPDDKYLLSVSRDRNWAVHVAGEANSGPPYRLLASSDKKTGVHSRIIWSCCWSSDSKLFATASREGVCAVWSAERLVAAEGDGSSQVATRDWLAGEPKTFEEPVTAIEFAPGTVLGRDKATTRMIAVGTDSGRVHLCSFSIGAGEPWAMLHTIENLHSSTISRLSFRPRAIENSDDQLTLATSSHDHSVKLFVVRPSSLVDSCSPA